MSAHTIFQRFLIHVLYQFILIILSSSMQGFSFDMVCIVGPEQGFQQNGEIRIRKFCIFCKKFFFSLKISHSSHYVRKTKCKNSTRKFSHFCFQKQINAKFSEKSKKKFGFFREFFAYFFFSQSFRFLLQNSFS